MDVGIRELKAKLSEYVERAASGETVRVTDRGRVKALLVPLPGTDRLAIGLKEGWIAQGPAVGVPPPVPRAFPMREGVRLIDILDEDRGL